MLENIQTFISKVRRSSRSLFDVRIVGIVMFLVVALMITWSGVHVIETNYKLQQDIARQQQQNEIEKLKNQNIALQNKYLESGEYLELEARKTLGLAAPGEIVWVVPKDVALRYTVPAEKTAKKAPADKPTSNFSAWMDFLFHRQS